MPAGKSRTPFDHPYHQDAVNPGECDLNAKFICDELEDFMTCIKRKKACDIYGISAEVMLKGQSLLHQCLLDTCNSMLAGDFPEQLSAVLTC